MELPEISKVMGGCFSIVDKPIGGRFLLIFFLVTVVGFITMDTPGELLIPFKVFHSFVLLRRKRNTCFLERC